MSADPRQIRILVADDHPLLRQGIAGLVADQSDMILVAEALNGREAILQFRAHRPDITLMDLQMPEMNGLDAIVAHSRRISRGTNHCADRLHRRRPGSTRPQSGRAGVPAKESLT